MNRIGDVMGDDVTLEADPLLDRDGVLALYGRVGWTAYTKDPDLLIAALRGSSRVIAARSGDALVGLARVISDGASIAYLQDVLVHPGYQRRGIGGALVRAALEPYESVRQKVLITDDEPGQAAFYASLGFAPLGGSSSSLRAFGQFSAAES